MDLVWVWFELVFWVEEEEAVAAKSNNGSWERGLGGERGERICAVWSGIREKWEVGVIFRES